MSSLWLVPHNLLYGCIILLEDQLLCVGFLLLAALGAGVNHQCTPVNTLTNTVYLQVHKQLWHHLNSKEAKAKVRSGAMDNAEKNCLIITNSIFSIFIFPLNCILYYKYFKCSATLLPTWNSNCRGAPHPGQSGTKVTLLLADTQRGSLPRSYRKTWNRKTDKN